MPENKDIKGKAKPPLKKVFAIFLISQCALAAVALWLVDENLWAEQSQEYSILSSLLYGVVLAVVNWALLFVGVKNVPLFADKTREMLAPIRQILMSMKAWQLVIVALMAGVSEELFFRALLQNYTAQYLPGLISILLVSIVFGLLHASSMAYFVFAFVISLIFGIVYFVEPDIVMLVVWHGVYDVIAMLVIVYRPTWLGLDVSETELGEAGPGDFTA